MTMNTAVSCTSEQLVQDLIQTYDSLRGKHGSDVVNKPGVYSLNSGLHIAKTHTSMHSIFFGSFTAIGPSKSQHLTPSSLWPAGCASSPIAYLAKITHTQP